jgi:hypothetical protein
MGATVEVVIAGEVGGCWVLTRAPRGWGLAAGIATAPLARVVLVAETAWRRWAKGVRPEAAQAAVFISGDRSCTNSTQAHCVDVAHQPTDLAVGVRIPRGVQP